MKTIATFQSILLAIALMAVIGLAIKNLITSFSFWVLGISVLYILMIWGMFRISLNEIKAIKELENKKSNK